MPKSQTPACPRKRQLPDQLLEKGPFSSPFYRNSRTVNSHESTCSSIESVSALREVELHSNMNSSSDKIKRPLLRHIPCSFNNADCQASALRLIFTLFPDWEHEEGEVKFTRFTDGITNTVRSPRQRPLICLNAKNVAATQSRQT